MGAAAALARRETAGRPFTSHGLVVAGVWHGFQLAAGSQACASTATLFERSTWKAVAITAKPNECLSC
jgi:hypothetical protein